MLHTSRMASHPKSKSIVTVTISLPQELLDQIENRRELLGITSRSAYICTIVRQDVARRAQPLVITPKEEARPVR